MENKVGRPTKYDANCHPAQVLKFCLVGLTDTQMANLFEISEATFNNWKKEHPEFLESIKRGKEEADANVALPGMDKKKGWTSPSSKTEKNKKTTRSHF